MRRLGRGEIFLSSFQTGEMSIGFPLHLWVRLESRAEEIIGNSISGYFVTTNISPGPTRTHDNVLDQDLHGASTNRALRFLIRWTRLNVLFDRCSSVGMLTDFTTKRKEEGETCQLTRSRNDVDASGHLKLTSYERL